MKVLLSAYACEPGRGSEGEAGLRTLLTVAAHHDVWVLTRENNLPALQRHLAGHPAGDRIHLEGLDLSPRLLAAKRLGLPGLHFYYDGWQRAVADRAARLHARIGFDLAHHVTFAQYWTRVGVADLGIPVVWGPVGGAVVAPMKLYRELGLRGLASDAARVAVRRLVAASPIAGAAPRRANIIFVQNSETADRIGARDRVRILPNTLAVDVVPPQQNGRRRSSEIAVVGRLVPLKGVSLAVRALSFVASSDATMCVYGDGPEAGRVRQMARRLGVSDRLHLGGRLPRNELLERVGRSGVLLHPALHDESGWSVAEALAMGTPVVCLSHGGPAQLTRFWPQVPSELVPAGWPAETAQRIAEAIDRLLRVRPPIPTRAHPPTVSYGRELLHGYEMALEHGPH